MRLHVVAPLLFFAFYSTASADLVRIDFTGPVGTGSARPTGQVLQGSLVYDSNAQQTGALFNGGPPRFDGALTEFQFAGIDGSWPRTTST